MNKYSYPHGKYAHNYPATIMKIICFFRKVRTSSDMRSSYSSGAHPRGHHEPSTFHLSPIVNSALSAVRPEKRFSLPGMGAYSAMAEYDRRHRAVLSLRAMADGPIRWRPCRVFTACSIGTTWSDGAMEDALYEIASMRLFARLSPR